MVVGVVVKSEAYSGIGGELDRVAQDLPSSQPPDRGRLPDALHRSAGI